MIKKQLWQCPKDHIDRTLNEFDFEGAVFDPVHPASETTGELIILNQPTGNFFYDPWEIKEVYKGTGWGEILDTLPYTIGQARVIKLDPGKSYLAHADIDNRWHLNLTGEFSYLIDLDATIMYECKNDGYWSYMDTSHIHSATNYGSIPRWQLVVRELLFRSRQYTDLTDIRVEPAYPQIDFRYKFDNILSPFLNRANQKYKLADFSHDFKSASFRLERELLEEFEKLITPEFKVTYA